MIHPTDYRYKVDDLENYLSPAAILRYMLRVECAYIHALSKQGVCSSKISKEYEKAASKVTYERVQRLEAELKHDIKAIVEALKEQVSPEAKPFCHLGLTSYDTVTNAHALLIKDVTARLILPDLAKTLRHLIQIALKYKSIVQMGRTHGQHAEPTTFGYAMANYIERMGMGIWRIKLAAEVIGGKIGGAVGTRASLGLLANAEKIEAETLKLLDLTQINAPTQIINQEELANYYSQIILCFGTLADLANDLRQLQRTEIAEVFEGTTERQVGSSTMPQKRNPIGWENIISHYKAVLPRLITSYLNLISEHQRDLTDSAANRYLLAEVLNSFLYSVRRVSSLLQSLEVDTKRMKINFDANDTFELAEPAYILLARSGIANAHEVIKQIARQARRDGVLFKEALLSNETFRRCFGSLSSEQKQLFEDSSKYIGRAVLATEAVCRYWKRKLGEFKVT